MTFLLDILEDYLDLRELQYSRLDGTMSFTVRQEQVHLLCSVLCGDVYAGNWMIGFSLFCFFVHLFFFPAIPFFFLPIMLNILLII